MCNIYDDIRSKPLFTAKSNPRSKSDEMYCLVLLLCSIVFLVFLIKLNAPSAGLNQKVCVQGCVIAFIEFPIWFLFGMLLDNLPLSNLSLISRISIPFYQLFLLKSVMFDNLLEAIVHVTLFCQWWLYGAVHIYSTSLIIKQWILE